MPKFIKGLALSRLFYKDIIRPIMERHDHQLQYAAGLVGDGSEVLGYDDKMSTDHDWGPSVTLFLERRHQHLVPVIDELMRHELPHHFRGYSTNFISSPESPNNQVMAITTRGAVNHNVDAITIDDYMQCWFDLSLDDPIRAIDWLTIPSQRLRTFTRGGVFHDGIGDLTHLRAMLAWYPDDVWLYLMAAQWDRIGEEEHLMGRAGYTGDELGATLIANRLVNDVMRLCFLMEREYAPYAKWFGRAFSELESSTILTPILRQFQIAEDWKARQSAYAQIIEFILDRHNQLNIAPSLPVRVKRFHTRPFMIADGRCIASGLRQHITDSEVIALQSLPSAIGSIDQISDETGLRSHPKWRSKLRKLYEQQQVASV